MTHQKQVEDFADALDSLINRFKQEYDLDYASITGTLQFRIFTLNQEVQSLFEGEELE